MKQKKYFKKSVKCKVVYTFRVKDLNIKELMCKPPFTHLVYTFTLIYTILTNKNKFAY